MPVEQVPDGGPGHAFRPGLLQGAEKLVGDGIAKPFAEDVRGGSLAVLPHRQGRREVALVDIPLTVEQGVDERQPALKAWSATGSLLLRYAVGCVTLRNNLRDATQKRR